MQCSRIRGYAILASDGQLGLVDDLLCDSLTWSVRWLVVDTDNWRDVRMNLLPPMALGIFDRSDRHVSLQVPAAHALKCPDVDVECRLTRAMESRIYNHYGWNPYWTATSPAGPMPLADAPREPRRASLTGAVDALRLDNRFHSASALAGYSVEATDGRLGHVEDLLIDVSGWTVNCLRIAVPVRLSGRLVTVVPTAALLIDPETRTILLDIDRATAIAGPRASSIRLPARRPMIGPEPRQGRGRETLHGAADADVPATPAPACPTHDCTGVCAGPLPWTTGAPQPTGPDSSVTAAA